MNINAYSMQKNANLKVSNNFRVREFACQDGTDPVFIDRGLVSILQKIRDHFDRPVYINSGYRTPAHNERVGGAKYSQHLYGMAADISVSYVNPEEVAKFADTLMPNSGGVGLYNDFVHIDIRTVKARWVG